MAIMRWRQGGVPSVFDALTELQEEMNRHFDDFGRIHSRELMARAAAFSPKLDMSETDKEVKVSAEIPGLDEKDVEVTLDDDVLMIKGEKKEEHIDKEARCCRIERSYGSFYRAIPLPAKVDAAKVQATFKKGVLSVSMPKLPGEKGGIRKIAIKTE